VALRLPGAGSLPVTSRRSPTVVITEVRIKLCEANSERLLAFCSVTFGNAFVVRDLKIIDGTRGVFVAMPSRKLTDRCGGCGSKNHLRARFCNGCGHRLDENRAGRDADGRAKLHADIAHPIHSRAREEIQNAVVKAYGDEKERAKQPGYVCRYDDYDSDFEEADAAASYGGVVAEMGRVVKAHGPHQPGPRGIQAGRQVEGPRARTASGDGFGAGIV
jgi:stage V sporulation protein G